MAIKCAENKPRFQRSLATRQEVAKAVARPRTSAQPSLFNQELSRLSTRVSRATFRRHQMTWSGSSAQRVARLVSICRVTRPIL